MSTEIDRKSIEEAVRRILSEMASPQVLAPVAEPVVPTTHDSLQVEKEYEADDGVFDTVDEAVAASTKAYLEWRQTTLERRYEVIEAIRQEARNYAVKLAEMACAETGLGRVECKTNKNRLVADKTPGPEFLRQVAYSGDHGLTLIERAPYGVIASITPTTNPTSTIINNAISILSGGNTVVFNAHPRAKKVSLFTISLLNRAIRSVGGPYPVLTTVREPTVESAQYLMSHPKVDLLLVTGGPAVVQVAMRSGKRAICAGPGNPPVVVDETAVLERAGHDIVSGCSFDNNLVCIDEKEVFVVEQIAESLKEYMKEYGAFEVPSEAIGDLERVIFTEMGSPAKPAVINPRWVGQNAADILRAVGINVDDRIRVAFLDVPVTHPLVWTEQMMPVIPLVKVGSVNEGIELALRAEHGFRHSAVMHSLNLDALSRMARVMDTAIFVKNAPGYAGLGFGGEGYTSMSIGTKTGEGITTCLTFTRDRRCTLVDYFRIV